MDLLSPDEAREAVEKSGATALPSAKTLKECAVGKVFSGRKPDGTIWKITRQTEDGFVVE
jgi:hypothetical protein